MRALLAVRIGDGQQHQRHRQLERGAEAADDAADDQDGRRRRQCADQCADGEQGDAEYEDAAAAVDVSDRAAGQQQAGIDKVIGVDHPLHLADAGVKIAGDALEREIDDRRVDLRQQYAERGREKNEARTHRVLRVQIGWGVRLCRRHAAHDSTP